MITLLALTFTVPLLSGDPAAHYTSFDGRDNNWHIFENLYASFLPKNKTVTSPVRSIRSFSAMTIVVAARRRLEETILVFNLFALFALEQAGKVILQYNSTATAPP